MDTSEEIASSTDGEIDINLNFCSLTWVSTTPTSPKMRQLLTEYELTHAQDALPNNAIEKLQE